MKPEPKHVVTVCSVCELPWEDHGEDPTLETCVGLLAAELKKPRPSGNTFIYGYGHTCARCGQYVNGNHTCYPHWTYTVGNTNSLKARFESVTCQLKASS